MDTFKWYKGFKLINFINNISKLAILIVLIILNYKANAQSNTTLKKYILKNSGDVKSFEVLATTCSNNTWEYCFTPVKIEIKNKLVPNDYQVINISTAIPPLKEIDKRLSSDTRTTEYSAYERYTFIFGDFNFDGCTDFAHISGLQGNYGSPSYTFYLYDKSDRKYKSNSHFSELTIEGRNVPNFNYVQKEIISSEKIGAGNLSSYYHVISNKPQLFKVIQRDYINKANNLYLKTTIKTLNNKGWSTAISFDEYKEQ